jgi:hypothetical protein
MLRGEGEAAREARRLKAEDTIAKAQYTGSSKRFTLQSYINLLQNAFTELAECGADEEYSEQKKVSVFVRGLKADRFRVTRQLILQNTTLRNDFQAAYAFCETANQLSASTETGSTAFDRNISQVSKAEGKEGSYVPEAEWRKLTRERRQAIMRARKSRGNGGKGQGPKPKEHASKRKLAELATAVTKMLDASAEEESGASDSGRSGKKKSGTPGKSPADQFGRNVHSVMREFAKAVGEELGDSQE